MILWYQSINTIKPSFILPSFRFFILRNVHCLWYQPSCGSVTVFFFVKWSNLLSQNGILMISLAVFRHDTACVAYPFIFGSGILLPGFVSNTLWPVPSAVGSIRQEFRHAVLPNEHQGHSSRKLWLQSSEPVLYEVQWWVSFAVIWACHRCFLWLCHSF